MDLTAISRGSRLARTWIVALACCAISLVRRSSGLDPESLWLDDQWIALALREASFEQLIAMRIPVPLGFVALQKLIAPLQLDPEWPLQIVPMLAGLATIPLFYIVLERLLRRPPEAARVLQSGVLAVATLAAACHATAELYSVRVKHYTLDLLLVIALLGGTIALLQRPSVRRMGALVLGGLVAAGLSFATVFVSLCCVHALALDRALRSWTDRAERRRAYGYLVCGAAFDLAVAALYLSCLRYQSNAAMRVFWQKYFLRFDDVDALLSFAYHGIGGFALHVMSPFLIVLLVFIPIGLRAVHRDPVLRPLSWICGWLIAGLMIAAALQLYPFGPQRTSLFAFPLLWMLAAVGVERTLSQAGPSRGWRYGRMLLAAYVIGVSILRPRVSYSDVRDRQVVEATMKWQRSDDVLLATQASLLAMSYYGERRVSLSPSRVATEAFESSPDWPGVRRLASEDGQRSLRSDPTLANVALHELTSRRPLRILYLSTHASDLVDEHVLKQLAAAGYTLSARYQPSPLARLIALESAAAPGQPKWRVAGLQRDIEVH